MRDYIKFLRELLALIWKHLKPIVSNPTFRKYGAICLVTFFCFRGCTSCINDWAEKRASIERNEKDVAENHAYFEQKHAEEKKAADTVIGTISAADLNAIYQQNEVDADKLVKGKRIIVAGRIARIRKDFQDKAHIELATGQYFQYIDCEVKEENATGLKRGQLIRIQGHVTGMIVNTVMIDATY